MNELENIQLTLRPVGIVRSDIKTPMLAASDDGIELCQRMAAIREYHRRIKDVICDLVVAPWLIEALEGIEDFSHVMVLYWPHLVPEERRSLRQVHPMGRKDLPKRGIFATCSPARPNPVLVSVVPLLKREGNVLQVRGLEAVDGSPIIDIKPFVQGYHGAENPTVADWMKTIQRDLEEGPLEIKS
jgi:tRNA-Thr(GGU) m(6)t(6)A37 methyltransferase TsaA